LDCREWFYVDLECISAAHFADVMTNNEKSVCSDRRWKLLFIWIGGGSTWSQFFWAGARAARFFLAQFTNTGQKYTKLPQNIPYDH
jgi:hypothetical protein